MNFLPANNNVILCAVGVGLFKFGKKHFLQEDLPCGFGLWVVRQLSFFLEINSFADLMPTCVTLILLLKQGGKLVSLNIFTIFY